MLPIKTFLDTVAIYGKPSTVRNYGFWLAKFQDYTRKTVEEVQAEDVAKWVATLKLKYAPMSIALGVAVIKEYLHDFAPQINTRRIRLPKAHSVHPSDPLTPEEYVSMLSFIRADTKKGVLDNLVHRLLYDTGARVGEIKWLFDHQEKINLEENYAVIDTEKTSEKRYIAWGHDTGVFIKTWLSFHRPFPTIRTMERIVRQAAEKAKITAYKKVTCHSYRHTKAHRVLQQGGNVNDLQKVLGHKDPSSSFHYLNDFEQAGLVRQRRWVDG